MLNRHCIGVSHLPLPPLSRHCLKSLADIDSRTNIRIGQIVDDMGIQRTTTNILQPRIPHLRTRMERRIPMDLYRFPSRPSHFIEVQRIILDQREIPVYLDQHDYGRGTEVDQSLDR